MSTVSTCRINVDGQSLSFKEKVEILSGCFWAGVVLAICAYGFWWLFDSYKIDCPNLNKFFHTLEGMVIYSVTAGVVGLGLGIYMYRREVDKEVYSKIIKPAEELSSNLIGCYRNSVQMRDGIARSIDKVVPGFLKQAKDEFDSNAYAPFWDIIEGAARELAYINEMIRALADNAEVYHTSLQGLSHNFPPFAVSLQEAPKCDDVLNEFRRIVRLGQTNRDFAMIWEQRQTRKVLIAGFSTLRDAIYHMSDTIGDSTSLLEKSILSSSTAQNRISEEQRKLLEKNIELTRRQVKSLEYLSRPR